MEKKMSREQVLEKVAKTYTKFLNSIDLSDPLIRKGLDEGIRKFLPNLHIRLLVEQNVREGMDKRYISDFVSKEAIPIVERKALTYLTYEHIVPRQKYIQSLCVDKATVGELEEEFVFELLKKYLWTATITKAENKMLRSHSMPDDWDGENILARYEEAGIELCSYKSDIKTLEKNHQI